MLSETIRILAPRDGARVLDCTFGGGGHAVAILEAADCRVLGCDRDPDAILRAREVKATYNDRFDFRQLKFSDLYEALESHPKFDGVLFDFGISSFQVDNASRGFSFSREGPLDMRMSASGLSAYDVVNSFSENDIARIIHMYGDEPYRRSGKIAMKIVRTRELDLIRTTTELREIVKSALGFEVIHKRYSNVDVATKTFQAIRIFVNDELREIDCALSQLPKILNNKARVATISFHSLEDRIVKNWAKLSNDGFVSITKPAIRTTKEEILSNPRSRSAILRGFEYNCNWGDVDNGDFTR